MGQEQRYEQHNKDVKGDGGILVLTEEEEKLHCWMICGPEVARAVAEFEFSSVLRRMNQQNFATMKKLLPFKSGLIIMSTAQRKSSSN